MIGPKKIEVENVKDELLRKYLAYYDFLSNNDKLMLKEDKERLAYSRCFWHIKYKKRYFELFGYDAGIEQEEYKLLEEIDNELENGIDWAVVQQMEESEK